MAELPEPTDVNELPTERARRRSGAYGRVIGWLEWLAEIAFGIVTFWR